ncbi:hypothetical protein SASPL_101323 [Salvia splendens]|uniref:Uncharacterized protein n=1 Tax=Salvia splendens TaxID=180675 RepID=A0A8X8YP28_SALSN|nr:hypothetical protein SASPL_101323 [Salvia splendens]
MCNSFNLLCYFHSDLCNSSFNLQCSQSMENDVPANIHFTDFADVFVVETIEAFSAVMQDFGKRIESKSPVLHVTEKRKRVEDFYCIG